MRLVTGGSTRRPAGVGSRNAAVVGLAQEAFRGPYASRGAELEGYFTA